MDENQTNGNDDSQEDVVAPAPEGTEAPVQPAQPDEEGADGNGGDDEQPAA